MDIPIEIDSIILSSLDPKSIVSYITTKKDTYRKALHDHFWISLNHETFQNVFYYMALYGYSDIMETMLKHPYHILDERFLNKVQLYMALNGNEREFKVITDYMGNNEVYEIDIEKEINTLIKLLLEGELIEIYPPEYTSSNKQAIINLLARLSRYYYREFLVRSIIKKVGINNVEWLIKNHRAFPSDFIYLFVGELVYFDRFDDVKRILEIDIEAQKDTLFYLYGEVDNSHISINRFDEGIIKYASAVFYKELYREINNDYPYSLYDVKFITNPTLYKYLIRGEDEYLEEMDHQTFIEVMRSGYGLDPYVWLNIIQEERIRIRAPNVKEMLRRAKMDGFTYFCEVISKNKNEFL